MKKSVFKLVLSVALTFGVFAMLDAQTPGLRVNTGNNVSINTTGTAGKLYVYNNDQSRTALLQQRYRR